MKRRFSLRDSRSLAVKQLAFSTWKALLSEGELFVGPKGSQQVKQARKHHLANLKAELSKGYPSFKSCWYLDSPFPGVHAPPPFLPIVKGNHRTRCSR